MIVYNITCHIEKSINTTFISWIKEEFHAKLKTSPFITDNSFLKLITEIDDQSFTYSIQITFESWPYYQQFQVEEETLFLGIIQKKFEGKIFTFTTLLEKI